MKFVLKEPPDAGAGVLSRSPTPMLAAGEGEFEIGSTRNGRVGADHLPVVADRTKRGSRTARFRAVHAPDGRVSYYAT